MLNRHLSSLLTVTTLLFLSACSGLNDLWTDAGYSQPSNRVVVNPVPSNQLASTLSAKVKEPMVSAETVKEQTNPTPAVEPAAIKSTPTPSSTLNRTAVVPNVAPSLGE